MSIYSVFGPFEIPRAGGIVNDRAGRKFFGDVERECRGLSAAVGCYVFAISAAKGARPWYVGKTEKHNFKGEAWTPHKLLLYN
jgi:hypothetical protein